MSTKVNLNDYHEDENTEVEEDDQEMYEIEKYNW